MSGFSCLVLFAIAASPASSELQLDFHGGTLAGWEGEGFYLTNADGLGPSLHWGVCSSDRGPGGRAATLYRSFVVPADARQLTCFAYAALGNGCLPDGELDVVLLAAGKQIIPEQVRAGSSWRPVHGLLPPEKHRPHDYAWQIDAYAGQTVCIALLDNDKRPGCHVVCSGFQLLLQDGNERRDFTDFMLDLQNKHKLGSMNRFSSKHFMAVSNAEDEYTQQRLRDGELIYDVFYDHFRRKGFRIHEPAGKLMVAIFDSQAGFEAYLAKPMPSMVTGIYHRPTNRFVVYDVGTNRAFVAQRQQGLRDSRSIASEIDRQRYLGALDRHAQQTRNDTNTGTVMHEVAHQLSFNCGMLNRQGDVPAWLAEGLACYCEATSNNAWLGIGEANPERIGALINAQKGQGRILPIRELLASDTWVQHDALTGYAQSWALVCMLMEDRPEAMRDYLARIFTRNSPNHRLTDFSAAFGADIDRMEVRHQEHIKQLVKQNGLPKR